MDTSVHPGHPLVLLDHPELITAGLKLIFIHYTVKIEVVITHKHRCGIAVQTGTSLQA